jgi:hypothetical protein
MPNDLTRLKKTLLESVDEGFLSLGETMREVLYQYIQSKYQLEREEIPDHLETFHQALQNFNAGSKVMEKLIAKNLYTRLGLNFTERADWTLIYYVNNVAQGTHRSVSENHHGEISTSEVVKCKR